MAKKVTTEIYKERVKNMVGDEYIFKDVYATAKTKSIFHHVDCGRDFEMRPDNFSNGQRCPHCFGNKKRGLDEFKEIVYSLTKDEFIVLGDYKNTNTKIKMLHSNPKCNKEFEITPKLFLYGQRCSHCRRYRIGDALRKSQEQFEKELFDIVGEEYEVLGEYVNSNTHIDLLHTRCGRVVDMTPSSILHANHRCRYCYRSRGEDKIYDFLEKGNYLFENKYRDYKCRDKYPLEFDFALFDEYKNIVTVIEFDGVQHFEEVEGWGGRGKLEVTKRRDEIKNQYCISNNIKMIRIPYWEYENIEKILMEELKYEEVYCC